MMNKLQKIIEDLEDRGVSGEFDENFVTRRELADILKILVEELK